MKKIFAVLPFLLLGACAAFQGNEADYGDEAYDEETGLVIDDDFVGDVPSNRGYINPKPNRMGPPTQRPGQRYSGMPGQATISADGTMIELPPQRIYIGDIAGGQPGVIEIPQQRQPLSYSEPIRWAPKEQREIQPTIITLQNQDYPNTYVQCLSTDVTCTSSYEQQGYVHVSGLPQFAGYQETLGASDYPRGSRWRNNNNIPRW